MDNTQKTFKQLGDVMDNPKHAPTVLDLLQTSVKNQPQFLAVYAAFEKPINHITSNKMATLLVSFYKTHGVTAENKHILQHWGKKLPKKCQARLWEQHSINPIMRSFFQKPANSEHEWVKDAMRGLDNDGYEQAKYLLDRHVLAKDDAPLQIRTRVEIFNFLEKICNQSTHFKDFISTYSWTGHFVLGSNKASLAARYLQTEDAFKSKNIIQSGLMRHYYKEYPSILAHDLQGRSSMINPRVANIVRYTHEFLDTLGADQKGELAQLHLSMIKKNCPQITEVTGIPYLSNEALDDYFFRVASTPNKINDALAKKLRQFQEKQQHWTILINQQRLETVANETQAPKTTRDKI